MFVKHNGGSGNISLVKSEEIQYIVDSIKTVSKQLLGNLQFENQGGQFHFVTGGADFIGSILYIFY